MLPLHLPRRLAILSAVAMLSTVSIAPAASATPTGRAWAVSCSSADACTAVGDTVATNGPEHSMAKRWDGVGWSTQPFPRLAGAAADGLTGVACPTATSCFATGWRQAVPAAQQSAFVAHWDGDPDAADAGWSLQPLAMQDATGNSSLMSISCTSAVACTAVGTTDYWTPTQGSSARTLAYRWDGTSWSLEATVNPSSSRNGVNRLNSVSCGSASFCVAVGLTDQGPLLETWNGHVWATHPTASPPGASGYSLDAVSCTAPDACTAVGGYSDRTGWPRTLVERWDGVTWTVQDIPSTQAQNSLNAVSCSSARACVAVGQGYPQAYQLLIERWDGSTWTIDPVTPKTGSAQLASVSCTAPTACMAGGWVGTQGDTMQPVFEELVGRGPWLDVSALVDAGPPPPPPPLPPPPHRHHAHCRHRHRQHVQPRRPPRHHAQRRHPHRRHPRRHHRPHPHKHLRRTHRRHRR